MGPLDPLASAVSWRLGMVVRQPPVLLLDECTSALDPTTQEAAQKTILKDFPRQGGQGRPGGQAFSWMIWMMFFVQAHVRGRAFVQFFPPLLFFLPPSMFLLVNFGVGLVGGWIGAITSLHLHTYLMLRHKKSSCNSTTTPCYVKCFT